MKGQLVVEVVGRCLTQAEYERLDDTSYVLGFPDRVVAAKLRRNDPQRYIDPREHGNLFRVVNDSREAPNLQLVYP